MFGGANRRPALKPLQLARKQQGFPRTAKPARTHSQVTMKGTSLCLGLLAAAPAHGFLITSLPCSSGLKTTPTYGTGFLGTASTSPVVTSQRQRLSLSRHSPHRGGGALAMLKTDFSKTLATILIVGSTIGVTAIPLMSRGPESRGPKTVRVTDEDGNVSERGALTTMTRPEIQKKLAQIPVFFLRDESGGVHVEGGEGLFFMSPEDAKAKLQGLKGADGVKVAATTLDDVWFPLIKKKGLSKKPVAAQASMSSDLSARYKIIPRSSQVTQAMETAGWNAVDDKDGVPVWAADTLAFKGTGAKLKMPLFTNVDDLMTSWERLKTDAGSEAKSPTIQVSSIGAIIEMMERQGGDNRNLEFFADMDAIEQAEKLL